MSPTPEQSPFMHSTPTDPVLLKWEYASVFGVMALWVFLLLSNIGVGLIAGLAIFALTRYLRNTLGAVFSSIRLNHSRPCLQSFLSAVPAWLTTFTVACLVLIFTFGVISGARMIVQSILANGPSLLNEAFSSILAVIANLPPDLQAKLPDNPQELMALAQASFGSGLGQLKSLGGAGFSIFIQLVFALILGVSAGLIAGNSLVEPSTKPLALAWTQVIKRYTQCFALFMGAQVYVSLWNTLCTALFVYGLLPAFDVILPFRELLLIFTALASLIPAAGNIMANTLILVLTLKFGPVVAGCSVAYLFLIHKLEYFVNGYFMGKNVQASVPEMLVAIILGEIAFGLPGLITAPVTYAFLKMHWKRWEWV